MKFVNRTFEGDIPPRLTKWLYCSSGMFRDGVFQFVSMFLLTSLAPIVMISTSFKQLKSDRRGRQNSCVCSSTRIKSLSWGQRLMASSKSLFKSLQMITFCLLMNVFLFCVAKIEKNVWSSLSFPIIWLILSAFLSFLSN